MVVFRGVDRIAAGTRAEAFAAARQASAEDAATPVLIFDVETGRVVDLEPDGPPTVETARRGRPKLGVTAREVTLLPRHWDWLAAQPGGASVALRRLVEAARKADPEGDQAQARRDAAYHFMSAMGGDLPGFEEASRALFADDRDKLSALTSSWPGDVADQVARIMEG